MDIAATPAGAIVDATGPNFPLSPGEGWRVVLTVRWP
jgi:hypothetical protein